ncbi:MAG: hypothetical protein WA040_23095 [Anaerolineae bacterium]
MPLCQGCGASFDDAYKFCPQCGRAKPEPQAINLNVQVAPVRYEEAVLKIEVLGTSELTEPPFDWRPSGMTKLMGEAGKNWTHITRFRLLLDCIHPWRGQYVGHESMEFRGFAVQHFSHVELPHRFQYNRTFQSWADRLFEERVKVWESTNQYLIQEGWIGLTEYAINRVCPPVLHTTSTSPDDSLLLYRTRNVLAIEFLPNPPAGMIQEVVGYSGGYRYRRIAS